MFRTLIAIIIGFLTWGALLIGSSMALWKILPDLFYADGLTDDWRILSFMLIANMIYSVLAGFVCAWIDNENPIPTVIGLAIVNLCVGIFLQLQYGSVFPFWYQIPFLAFIIPATIAGGDLRHRSKKWLY